MMPIAAAVLQQSRLRDFVVIKAYPGTGADSRSGGKKDIKL